RMPTFDGLCYYGNSVECCWGWRQSEQGRCQPHCQQGCKHGVCVGPDRCKCHPGYSGKACNQEAEQPCPPSHMLLIGLIKDHDVNLNECGLKPRPCKHRCMNTPGSYKCYCQDGYTLQSDGSCRNARTCYHANCQYGCEVSKGVVRCTCPSPGLQLGPDKRTCVDIDECALGATCPRHRKCVNTFGSFLCKCHYGFKLTYINGGYVCIGLFERHSLFSVASTTPRTTPSTTVPNTTYSRRPATPTTVTATPSGEPSTLVSILTTPPHSSITSPAPTTTIPNTTTHSTSTSMPPLPSTTHPITTTTTPPTPHTTPTSTKPFTVFNYTPATTPTTVAPTVAPSIAPSIVWDFDIELGNTAEEDAMDDPSVVLRCTFDHGLCDWLSDREGDLHWETFRDNTGDKASVIPRGWSRDVLCFSFSHWLTGHNVGVLQLFVKRRGRDQSTALWSRTGGHGWRHTQMTLTTPTLDQVRPSYEFKWRQGRIAVDDVALRRGECR
uniref:Nephronectin-like n=1 Tax=Cynoglossus semilaevis TaxID=244447 RepID=A0A3P8V2Q4_CYNSE